MSGTARRTTELAESFVNLGHSVTVLTSTPREYRSFPDYTFRYYDASPGWGGNLPSNPGNPRAEKYFCHFPDCQNGRIFRGSRL